MNTLFENQMDMTQRDLFLEPRIKIEDWLYLNTKDDPADSNHQRRQARFQVKCSKENITTNCTKDFSVIMNSYQEEPNTYNRKVDYRITINIWLQREEKGKYDNVYKKGTMSHAWGREQFKENLSWTEDVELPTDLIDKITDVFFKFIDEFPKESV